MIYEEIYGNMRTCGNIMRYKENKDAFLMSGQSWTIVWMPNLKFKTWTDSNLYYAYCVSFL